MQIYYDMAPPNRFGEAPRGKYVLQPEIECSSSNSGKYVVAVYPQSDSVSWYFLTPSGEVWINGLDGVPTSEECILLFESFNDASMALDRQMAGFANSIRWALFKTEIDSAGDLRLGLFKEYKRADA